MSRLSIPRLLFAAPSSASGKTTVTCAVLRALVRRGLRIASFKCGPDYIDPMFHRESVGTVFSSNLDLFLSDANTVRRQLCENASGLDLAVLEGVMGFYDGVAGKSLEASSYAVAQETETPVVLVVNCRGLSVSVAALVKGFLEFRKDSRIAAVILNYVSPSLYPDLKESIEKECGVHVAGYLPMMKDCVFGNRHLGLVTAEETQGLGAMLNRLAEQAEKTVELDMLLRLGRSALPLEYGSPLQLPRLKRPVRIAVARDRAFCFYYPDTLRLLETIGAQLVNFSPLDDPALPQAVDGLYLGGGYPELYAAPLSQNIKMLRSVREAVERGLPTIAECGGFLYLHRSLEDENGVTYPMAGVLAAEAFRTTKLSRFGYITLTARRDTLLCGAGDTLPAHEFHYWDSTGCGDACNAQKPLRSTSWPCVYAEKNLWAGFPHLYFPAVPKAAYHFLLAAEHYQKGLTQ